MNSEDKEQVVMTMEEGEITTVTVNSSKRKSPRSTIPMSVQEYGS
ncbi:MAG TPA: hypothetical protein VHH33_05865 [Nitrososphaeraceae archaeon]|nr:hypothetical protein [Nitrososphaeraceae archaeon]